MVWAARRSIIWPWRHAVELRGAVLTQPVAYRNVSNHRFDRPLVVEHCITPNHAHTERHAIHVQRYRNHAVVNDDNPVMRVLSPYG
jgi:hypothetical protein